MSTDEPDVELFDAPNQQVVRPDGSAPWDEGNGGTPADPKPDDAGDDLDAMTKDELLAYAEAHDVDASASMTKAEIRAAIDDA